MKRFEPAVIIAAAISMALSLGTAACSGGPSSETGPDSQAEQQASQPMEPSEEQLASPQDDGADTEAGENAQEEPQAGESPEVSSENSAVVDEVLSDLDMLSDEQRDSLAMLNYLMVVTERISSSSNSRLVLEETYSNLIDNTYPNAVDDRTKAQLDNLLDTIEGYRMVDVKRERLQFIYEQNKAQAIRSAIPNPLGLLSAVQSGNLAQLAGAVIYMAVDSVTSYQSASSAADLQYLMDGWELDDQESAILHQQRKGAFGYMLSMVQGNDLPGYLALNESAVAQLVEWSSGDNLVQTIRHLERNQETYKGYAGYWLILSSCYYENGDYQKCLEALFEYEAMSCRILRKDYDYAHAIPAAIVAASLTMDDAGYTSFAEFHIQQMVENCDNTDWELLYFAAQTYVDLYGRTGDADYLRRAYELAYDNVSFLIDEQEELNAAYLAPIAEAKAPEGATKEQEDEVKQYNKMLKEVRKTELPPVSQPLLLNCDLLLALADELGIPESERETIDRMIHPGGADLFLTEQLDERYRFGTAGETGTADDEMSFNGTKLVLPAAYLSSYTAISVSTSSSGEIAPGEWSVTKVDRHKSENVEDFTATIECWDARGAYKDGDIVTVTLVDGDGDAAVTREIRFRASVEDRPLFLPDAVSFERI